MILLSDVLGTETTEDSPVSTVKKVRREDAKTCSGLLPTRVVES